MNQTDALLVDDMTRLNDLLNLLERGVRVVQRHGLRETLRRSVHELQKQLYLHETHVWYALDLSGTWPQTPLPSGLLLCRAEGRDLEMLRQLPTTSGPRAERRSQEGADVWIVHEGDRAAFSCWIYRQTAPAVAAHRGQLPLPPHVVCLEESVTAEAYRGRGVAPAAWAAIARALRAQGVQTIITKVETGNAPSRRAVTKAGYLEVALMEHRRAGPVKQVNVRLPGQSGEMGRFLRSALAT